MKRAKRARAASAWVGVVMCFALAGCEAGGARPTSGQAGTLDLAGRVQGRAAVFVAGDPSLEVLVAEGQALPAPSRDALLAASRASDAEAFVEVARNHHVGGVLVAAHGGDGTVAAELAKARAVPGLRGVYFAPAASLYELDLPLFVSDRFGAALAHVARGILEGKRAPRASSFPAALRQRRNIEVVVVLRKLGEPVLWRSARAGTIAGALVTAAEVARDRWRERAQALGGQLDTELAKLTVEVGLIFDDGTLGAFEPQLVERTITRSHGVAYERKGGWHYRLPETTWKEASPLAAYRRLFEETDLPDEALSRPDLRFYRILYRSLGVSAPVDAAWAAGRSTPKGERSVRDTAPSTGHAADRTDEALTMPSPIPSTPR